MTQEEIEPCFYMFITLMFRVWERTTDRSIPFTTWFDEYMFATQDHGETIEETLLRCEELVSREISMQSQFYCTAKHANTTLN